MRVYVNWNCCSFRKRAFKNHHLQNVLFMYAVVTHSFLYDLRQLDVRINLPCSKHALSYLAFRHTSIVNQECNCFHRFCSFSLNSQPALDYTGSAWMKTVPWIYPRQCNRWRKKQQMTGRNLWCHPVYVYIVIRKIQMVVLVSCSWQYINTRFVGEMLDDWVECNANVCSWINIVNE